MYIQVNEGFDSWEEKILYYADKIVMHDKITTLKERLKEGHSRYRERKCSGAGFSTGNIEQLVIFV